MRRSRNWVSLLAAIGMAGLVTLAACKSSDESPQAPGETRPNLSEPPAHGGGSSSLPQSGGDAGGGGSMGGGSSGGGRQGY